RRGVDEVAPPVGGEVRVSVPEAAVAVVLLATVLLGDDVGDLLREAERLTAGEHGRVLGQVHVGGRPPVVRCCRRGSCRTPTPSRPSRRTGRDRCEGGRRTRTRPRRPRARGTSAGCAEGRPRRPGRRTPTTASWCRSAGRCRSRRAGPRRPAR